MTLEVTKKNTIRFFKKTYEHIAVKLNGPLSTSKTCWFTLKTFANDTKIIKFLKI